MNLALNNLQRLKCHKTQTNQTKPNLVHAAAAGAAEYTDCISAEG